MSGLVGGGGGGSMSATLNSLLEKTSNWDKDERYMATNDLCNELQKDIKIDATMERRICTAVLKQLDDNSNDVQTIAVKCLGALLRKVQEAQVGEICDKLCDLILDGKAELRDIYSIGLKTLISDVPDAFGPSVAQRLTVRLLGGVDQDRTVDIKLECLDNLTDLLKRFGREVEGEHERIMTVVLKQLPHERVVVRKRAATCLGSVAVVVSEPLLNRLAVHLLQKISEAPPPDVVRTLIQTIGTISRTVGYRLGRHLDSIVPLFLKFCGDPEDESQHTEAADELRENCFQGFESFVMRCPREVTPHLSPIINVALLHIRYDPNYSYGDDEDGDDDVDMDGEDDEEEFSDDEGGVSDDDDTSWKVRRSAIKVLKAVIECRSELPEELYNTCCDELIARFKEREENVRTDVVGCFSKLLEAVFSAGGAVSRHGMVPGRGGGGVVGRVVRGRSGDPVMGGAHHQYYHPHPPEAPKHMQEERQRVAVAALKSKLGAIVKASDKQLRGKSHKTIVAIFQMLRTLCVVLGGGLDEHMPNLIESSHRCLQDKNQSLKLEALLFLRLSMDKHPPLVFHATIKETMKYVTACVKEEWYKIIAEALRVVGSIVQIVRPLSREEDAMVDTFAYQPLVQPLYDAIFPRLSAHDIDQEIKECAITSMGLLLAHLASDLKQQLPEVLGLLMDRLGNEMTRMATLKALAAVSVSPLRVDLKPILGSATEELAMFLRQQSRPLKQTTLETLLALIGSNHAQMAPELFSLLLKESSALITDADLHLAHLSLKMSCLILEVSPGSAEGVRTEVLPRALDLSTSPLLQGLALSSLLSLFRVLVKINHRKMGFDDLLVALQSGVAKGGDRLQRQSIANIARCMAVLCAQTSHAARDKTVARLVKDMQGKDETRKHLGLLVVGELGRQTDLSRVKNLQEIILGRFEGGNEETKTAAAYAVGNIAVGNMNMYLPGILDAFERSIKHQYLLLSSLKEVIVCHATTPGLDFTPYVDQVLPHLFQHCTSQEEGVRNMVAECLGALTSMHPQRLVPEMVKLSGDSNPVMLWTLATSLKYCMAGKAPLAELRPHMETFLEMMHNQDLDVKKAALLMVNAAVHHQPFLVMDVLPRLIIPALYATVELKIERIVDLGPFKHKVDDGEPLRKAALSCIDTVLDSLPNKLDVATLMPYLAKGMGDSKPDVQMLCHQVVAKVSEYSPAGVLGSLDALIEPLEKTCNKQVKAEQVGTEVERANDLIRSALRCVVAISRVDNVEVRVRAKPER